MRNLLENMKAFSKAEMADFKGIPAAVFGSYGWDGAWVMEGVFKASIKALGYKVHDDVCVKTDSEIKYSTDETLEKCKAFGKLFAESL